MRKMPGGMSANRAMPSAPVIALMVVSPYAILNSTPGSEEQYIAISM